ncbi:rnp domain protein [Lichtheimia corymbifera JMRC:FSU:9682]|uniref:Rnp domain protein n=1 Tax=Lichtheimia corymbifera JMRC:FSU:9682 TaxID=1263082 RepID=A0A068RFL0_9FUNG|nr:rnp domain protein [Lichtheimia corymbifera JMRC:FSU:9682]
MSDDPSFPPSYRDYSDRDTRESYSRNASRSPHNRSYSRDASLSPHTRRPHLKSSSSRHHYHDSDDDYYRHRRHRSSSPRHGRRSSSRHHRSRSPPPAPPAPGSGSHASSSARRSSKGCRVYMGNLSYDCQWEDLKDFAQEVGTVVNANVLMTPSGKSKGCGVVEYSRPEYAERAIRNLNRTEFMGRPVFVREDREFEPKIPKDPRDAPEDQRIFVGNLSFSTSWQDLKDLFRKGGRVTHTDVDVDEETHRPKGSGLVIYDDPRDAAGAIEIFNGYEYRGRKLQVCLERDAPPPPPPQAATTKGQTEYRGMTSSTSYEGHGAPPPPAHFLSAPMGFVGGPAASTPSHGPNQIFVNNLPYSTTWQDLIDLFRHVGPVLRAEILLANGYPKGSGLVRFEEFTTCERAIGKFNGYLYGGRHLDVRLDKFSMPA